MRDVRSAHQARSAPSHATLLRVLLVLVSSGCFSPSAEDAGRPCGQLAERQDGGLFFTLSLCPADGSIFYDVRNSIRLERTDGGVIPFGDQCGACDRCPSLAVCDSFGVGFVEAGQERHLLFPSDGRQRSGSSTCPTTGDACEVRAPLPAGPYQARFCVSRSTEQNGTALGPLECKVVPLELPAAKGVWTSFE